MPSEEGRKLMLSGTFGGNERDEDSFKRRKKLASRLVRREMGARMEWQGETLI